MTAAEPFPTPAQQPEAHGYPRFNVFGRIVEVRRDGTIAKTVPLRTKGSIRLSRKTHTGTYLVADRNDKAIHEYDGGMDRDTAERSALADYVRRLRE